MTQRVLSRLFAAIALFVFIGLPDGSSAQSRIVFDPWNYKQTLLGAVRTLMIAKNQIEQLTNEARMLASIEQELKPLSGSTAAELEKTLREIETLKGQASGLALKVDETEAVYQRLFPQAYGDALSRDAVLRDARERWDLVRSSLEHALTMQAKISESVEADGATLIDLMHKSQSAAGNLQVQQAGNELAAFNAKQSLQFQNLMAAQYRAAALERARVATTQEEARVRFRTFLGDGNAYSPGHLTSDR